mgnify:CR=1 FL=1
MISLDKFKSGLIVLSAVLIAGGAFAFLNFTADGAEFARSLNWTEKTGEGIFAPACSSSSPSSFCSGAQAQATISWAYGGQHGSCTYANVSLSDGQSASGQPCAGGYTFNVANSTSYTYAITWIYDDPPYWGCSGSSSYCDKWGCSEYCYSYGWVDPAPVTRDSTSGGFSSPNCIPPPTVSMTANPSTIDLGSLSTLSWSSTNATSCSIDQGIGAVAVNGTRPVSPSTNTTYTITCSGPTAPPAQSSAAVTVNQPPGNFNLNLSGSVACNSVPLSWTSSGGATAYRILRGSPRVDISPYQPYTALNFLDTPVSQNTDYIYQIEAYKGALTTRSNAINVTTPYCAPTLDFSGFPTSIFQGQTTTLTWSSSYTTSCTASGNWSGAKALSGNQVVVPLPPPSVTYNLQCSGPGGSTPVQGVTVNITELALPEFIEIIPR